MDKMIKIFPEPKQVELKTGTFLFNENEGISCEIEDKRELAAVLAELQRVLIERTGVSSHVLIGKEGRIAFISDPSLKTEAYLIRVSETKLEIVFKEAGGAYYAVKTLKQLFTQEKSLPCLEIYDEPDFERRGVMLDISRDKIMTTETLYQLIDLFSDLKINELQLYVEGFTFAYDSYPEVWEGKTPVTPDEINLIEGYCKKHFIDLVPNMNSFGHMGPWLSRTKYKPLAESPDGFTAPWGTYMEATTLNPLHPGSLELVASLYQDMVPYFSSPYFNVGLDEPFELGKGQSREVCEKQGEEQVYLDYLLKIYELVKKHNRIMQFWGEIIIKSPQLLPKLPEDIIALEWGYEKNHPFEAHAAKYQESGRRFYVCPGTSSWNSLLGRSDNMKGNLKNAAISGKKYGAKGFLNTDWGDNGHLQYLPVSYAGFALGAGYSWNAQAEADEASYLNQFVFKDTTDTMGQLLYDLGNYYLRESVQPGNSTKLFQALGDFLDDSHFINDIRLSDYKALDDLFDSGLKRLHKTHPMAKDGGLIIAEIENGIRMARHGIKRIRFMFGDYENKAEFLENLKDEIELIIHQHISLWMARNRVSALDDSLERLLRLKRDYEERLKKA